MGLGELYEEIGAVLKEDNEREDILGVGARLEGTEAGVGLIPRSARVLRLPNLERVLDCGVDMTGDDGGEGDDGGDGSFGFTGVPIVDKEYIYLFCVWNYSKIRCANSDCISNTFSPVVLTFKIALLAGAKLLDLDQL